VTAPEDVKQGRARRDLSLSSFHALNHVTAMLIEAARKNRSEDVRDFATAALEELERYQKEQLAEEGAK